MSDVPVTIVLPSGGTRNAEVPNDVPVKRINPGVDHVVGVARYGSGWTRYVLSFG